MENLLTIENRKGRMRLGDSVTRQSVDKAIQDMDMLVDARAYDAALATGEITMDGKEPLEEMVMEIHSPGGSVLDGYRLYHKVADLRSQGVHVTAIINTLAASMASVIAMAADEVQMVKGGRMMIHEASQSVHGNAEEHQRAADLLESMSDEIAQIYADKTGKTKQEMRDLMKKETWMGAEQAKALGFADKIITGAGNFDTTTKTKATNTTNIMGFFAKLFTGTSGDPAEAFSDIKDRLISMEADHEAATAEIATAKAELATANETITELRAKVAELDDIKSQITAKDTQIADLTAKVEITDAKISERAAQLTAALGVPPVGTTVADPAPAKNALETFMSITDPGERTTYYNENKKAIRACLK